MGAGEVLEPRRLKTRTWGQCHLYPLRSLGPARPPGVGPEVRWWLGQGGDPSLSPQKPPPAWRELRPPRQDSRGTEAAILRMEPRMAAQQPCGAGGGRDAPRRPAGSCTLPVPAAPAPACPEPSASRWPWGRKGLRAAGHVPCCWPRVRPAEGAWGAGWVIGRAQPTGRGTGSPQPRGDPGKTGGSWGWVVRGPLGALLRGRWPRAPSAFPAPWQGPGSRGGGPGWAGQGGLSLSWGRGDPVSGNAGPPLPRLTCTEARPLLAGSASASCLRDTRMHTRPLAAPRLGHSAGRRSPTPDELTLRR